MYALGSTWLPDVSCFMAFSMFNARFHCFALPRAVMRAVYVLTFGFTPFCTHHSTLSTCVLVSTLMEEGSAEALNSFLNLQQQQQC